MRRVFLTALILSVSAAAAQETPKEYRHAITFVHPHRSTNLVTSTSPDEPTAMQPTSIQLPQTTDFGTFRLQYSYQKAFSGFSPWVALGGSLHHGFIDFKSAGNPQITEVTSKIGLGILAGLQYRFDFGKYLYLSPSLGYGHYFSSQIDVDFPTLNATQANGCHEICVTGSVDSILYSVVVGLRITRFLAFELGLEHDLFFAQRQQSITDGVTTTTVNQGNTFSEALMFSFGLTLQFNL
jgi:hypothetical protein